MKNKLYEIIEKAKVEKAEAEKKIVFADAKIAVATEMLNELPIAEAEAETDIAAIVENV